MDSSVSDSFRIATSVIVMCFIISVGMSILYIGRAFWSRTESSVESAVSQSALVDAYYLSQYSTPTPLAAMWKVVSAMDPLGDTGITTVRSFTVQTLETDADGKHLVVTTDRTKLRLLMSHKGYFAYEDNGDNTYKIVITVSDARQSELLAEVA